MLSKEAYMVIRSRNESGVYVKDIAAEIGVHPRTVRRALQRGGAPKRIVEPRPSKLDAYKPKVDELLSQNVWNVMVILREIQKLGYTGGQTMLRLYVHPKRVMRPSPATVRFETEPGKQLQSDWGEAMAEVAGQEVKVHFIVNELGYSRRFHFWCTDREDAEHTYEGLIRSFEYLGGVPQEVLVDNQKSAVLQASNSGHPKFNERFVDLAGHYGFIPRACRPHRPRTKGKDERMVAHIQHNFFVRYPRFESWVHVNQLAEQWLREEADLRLQSTVKEIVAERFQREQPHLQPLPAVRYDTSYLEYRKVAWDGYIDVSGNRYSVPPAAVGKRVLIRIGLDGLLRIYRGEVLVASHTLKSRAEGWGTLPEHRSQMWQSTLHVEQRSLATYEEVL